MALSVGNLLDTGCEKHRIQCDLSHLFYPLKPDFIHLHFIHYNASFLHLFNPLKPDFHRIKINNKNR